MSNRVRRPTATVSPGEWIRIPIPGEPFPVHMQIGPLAYQPAFIDHEPADGGYQTIAAVRCPELMPGDYDVKVLLPEGSLVESLIRIG